MNSRFNIITTVAYRIQCILKAVFEFMFSQMTKSKSNSCYIFDFDRIMAVKKTNQKKVCIYEKGILRPIFCIDMNTSSDRKLKIM